MALTLFERVLMYGPLRFTGYRRGREGVPILRLIVRDHVTNQRGLTGLTYSYMALRRPQWRLWLKVHPSGPQGRLLGPKP